MPKQFQCTWHYFCFLKGFSSFVSTAHICPSSIIILMEDKRKFKLISLESFISQNKTTKKADCHAQHVLIKDFQPDSVLIVTYLIWNLYGRLRVCCTLLIRSAKLVSRTKSCDGRPSWVLTCGNSSILRSGFELSASIPLSRKYRSSNWLRKSNPLLLDLLNGLDKR